MQLLADRESGGGEMRQPLSRVCNSRKLHCQALWWLTLFRTKRMCPLDQVLERLLVPITSIMDEHSVLKSAWLSPAVCLATALLPTTAIRSAKRCSLITQENCTNECLGPAGAVLLGFTHSGDFLVSYTSAPVAAADGQAGHHLQVPLSQLRCQLKTF